MKLNCKTVAIVLTAARLVVGMPAYAEESFEGAAANAGQKFDLAAPTAQAPAVRAGAPVRDAVVAQASYGSTWPAGTDTRLLAHRIDVPSPGRSRRPTPEQAGSSLAGAAEEGVAVVIGAICATVGVVLGAAYTATIIAPAFEMLINHDNHGPGPELSAKPFLSTFTWGIKGARMGYRAAKTAFEE